MLDAIVKGYVQNSRVNTDLPEPSAKLYQIKSGDTVEALARREFSASVRDGHDLRYYENVLLAVNRDKNRAGIKGTFQDPGIFGGGANNIQLEAGRRIWLVSPAYARSLESVVPDGSLTNGGYAKVKRVLGHIEDLVQSVMDSPQYFGEVVTNADHQVFGVITIGGGSVKGISKNALGNRGAIIFRGNQGVLVTEVGDAHRSWRFKKPSLPYCRGIAPSRYALDAGPSFGQSGMLSILDARNKAGLVDR